MKNQTLDEAILSVLPSEGDETKWLATKEVFERLLANGYEVYLKKVRRHLFTMQGENKVLAMSEPGKRAVFWQRRLFLGGGYKSAEHMPISTAVAFSMVRRLTPMQLPRTILGDIDVYYRAADLRLSLDHADGQLHKKWLEKITSVEPLFPLIRPPVDEKIFDAVKNAAFRERVIKIRYASMAAKNNNTGAKWKTILPLALVESAGVMYLVGQDMDNKPDPEKQKFEWLRIPFRLDRIEQVEETNTSFTYPADFELQTYVKTKKVFNFVVEDKALKLKLAFRGTSGNHLLESHMSEDQAPPEWDEHGRLIVSGTVNPSLKLEWWLRSFGPDLEIIEPQSLREKFAADARRLAEQYDRQPDHAGV
jgi:predicted DNA-binding transcriptional regulator YafY